MKDKQMSRQSCQNVRFSPSFPDARPRQHLHIEYNVLGIMFSICGWEWSKFVIICGYVKEKLFAVEDLGKQNLFVPLVEP